jgi:putative transposase
MRKSRFSETQIVAILREFDAGAPAEELARRHGIHAHTIRLWRSKYAGMNASDLARLKQLEAENAQMQRIIARQTVKIDAMEELMRKTHGAFPASRSREGAANARLKSTRSLRDCSCAAAITAREA